MQNNLKPDGAIVLTVDELKANDQQTSYLDLAAERQHPVNRMKALLADDSFHIPSLVVYDPENGGVEQGVIIDNYSPQTPFLKTEAIPGASHCIDDIDLETLRHIFIEYAKDTVGPIDDEKLKLVVASMLRLQRARCLAMDTDSLNEATRKQYKKQFPNTEHLTFGDDIKVTVTELVEKIRKGELHVLEGTYNFTLETFRAALESTMVPQVKIHSIDHVCASVAPTRQIRTAIVAVLKNE